LRALEYNKQPSNRSKQSETSKQQETLKSEG